MQGRPLSLERHGHVLVLTMKDLASDGNYVDQALADALGGALGAVEDDVRAVVLTGTDTVFATGLDGPPPSPGPAGFLASLRIPVIAAIHGDCLDRGLELALACDIRIAAPNARLGLRHLRNGLLPSDGGTQRLTRLVGRAHALRLLLTGDVLGAEEALRIGLVQLAGPREEALALAERISSAAPIAAAYTKEAVVEGLDLPLAQGLRLEADLSFLLHSTSDRAEGLRSFRDRRPPQFEGR